MGVVKVAVTKSPSFVPLAREASENTSLPIKLTPVPKLAISEDVIL